MYQKSSVCIETYGGLLVVDGWTLKDQNWNGWVIPVFAKSAADAIAEVIGLDVDGNTYRETTESNGDNDHFEEWTMDYNEELGVETVAIGAYSWCWSITDDEEMKDLNMNIIDRRTKVNSSIISCGIHGKDCPLMKGAKQ